MGLGGVRMWENVLAPPEHSGPLITHHCPFARSAPATQTAPQPMAPHAPPASSPSFFSSSSQALSAFLEQVLDAWHHDQVWPCP